MIEIGLTECLFIYFIIWMLIISFLWIRELLRIKRNTWYLSNTKLFHCDTCHHTFLTKDGANLTRCPICNAICIAKKRHRL